MGKPESGKAEKRESAILDYQLLYELRCEETGPSRRVTFTLFEGDIDRLAQLANRFSVSKSALVRYLLGELERRVDQAKRVQ